MRTLAPNAPRKAHLVTFMAALVAGVAAALWMVGPYLMSLYLGGMLAMLAYPAYQSLRRRDWAPGWAATAVTGLLITVVIVPVAGLSSLAVSQGISIAKELTEFKSLPPKAMSAALTRLPLIKRLVGNPERFETRLKDAVQSAARTVGTYGLELAKGVPEFFLEVGLALIAFYYFLVDGRRFKDWALSLGAFDREIQRQLVESIRESTESAVLAGLAAAVSQSAVITAAFLLLDVPGAFLAGGLTFVFAWIPIIGTVPATLAGAAYLCAQGSEARLALMIAAGLTASVVDNLVRPLVLRGRVDMHPLIGFIAIVGGLRMFGILGVFIGPMLAAMVLSLFKFWPHMRSGFGLSSNGR